MSQDDVERVARAMVVADNGDPEQIVYRATGPDKFLVEPLGSAWELYKPMARAALSAMPQRLSPDLIAQLNKLATYLTEQGEYEAVDLIDTVVARVSAMPQRELLAEALEALVQLLDDLDALAPARPSTQAIEEAQAAADKIRAAMGGEK